MHYPQAYDSGERCHTVRTSCCSRRRYIFLTCLSRLSLVHALWPLITLFVPIVAILSPQVYLENVDIEAPFLGKSPQQIKTANFIRPFIRGNRVPPPDQGFFQGRGADDFQRNMGLLVDVVKDSYLNGIEC